MTELEATELPKPKKKPPRRKPLWVCVPLGYDVPGDGSQPRPIGYEIQKCAGIGEVRKVLARHQIDPTNCGDVLLFRADPAPLKISAQVVFKF